MVNNRAKPQGPLRAEDRKELSSGEFLYKGRGCWEVGEGLNTLLLG